MVSLTDVQQLYKQWQDGKLLNTEERNALRAKPAFDAPGQSFADVLKSATESQPATGTKLRSVGVTERSDCAHARFMCVEHR